MMFYKRSHLYPLRAKPARIGLLEVPKESLRTDKIEASEVEMME